MSMLINRFLAFLIVLHLVAFIPNWCLAGEEESSFRCGSYLIELGESNYQVLDECGPPMAKESIGANNSYAPPPPGVFPDLETWVYNRGPTDFIYRLKFQGGSLVNIYRGDRGF